MPKTNEPETVAPHEERDAGQRLRQQRGSQMPNLSTGQPPIETGKQAPEVGQGSPREMLGQWRTLQAKLRKAEEIQKKTLATQGAAAAGKRGATLKQAAQKVTAQALKQAWMNLISSWGATILWIDVHCFLGAAGPLRQYFCPIGSEWGAPNNFLQKIIRVCEIIAIPIVNVIVFTVYTTLLLLAIIGFCISTPIGWTVCGTIIISLGITSMSL